MNQPSYKKIAFTTQQLESRVLELGNQISKDYEGKELVLIALLKGSLYFCADFISYVFGN